MDYRDILGLPKKQPKKKVEKTIKKQPPKPSITEKLSNQFGPLNEWSSKPPTEKRWSKKFNGSQDGENPTVAVQPDFELIAFDFVSNPSTQGAFMSPGQIKESINEGLGTRDGKCCHDCKVENIINDIFRGE